jgi:outer membrane protein TolC
MLPRLICAALGLAAATAAASPRPARADDPDPDRTPALTEASFLARMRARAPRYLAATARARAAATWPAAAAVRPNPTVAYEREAVPALATAEDRLRLGWALELGPRRPRAIAAAAAGAHAELLGAAHERALIESDARLAYLDAVHARARRAALEAARGALAELVATLRARATGGDASAYDADRAALELDALDDDGASATRSAELAELRLGALVGEPTTRVAPRDPLTLPAVPAAAGPAPGARADAAAAAARAAQAEHDRAAAQRAWIPRLELVAGLVAGAASGARGLGYVVGVGGELPVLDRGRAAAARSHAEAQRWRSEAAALAQEAIAELTQAQRDLALRVAQAVAHGAGPAARAAELARRASIAYREGDRTILELLDVLRTARHAAVRQLELVYEARRAEIELARARGVGAPGGAP